MQRITGLKANNLLLFPPLLCWLFKKSFPLYIRPLVLSFLFVHSKHSVKSFVILIYLDFLGNQSKIILPLVTAKMMKQCTSELVKNKAEKWAAQGKKHNNENKTNHMFQSSFEPVTFFLPDKCCYYYFCSRN